MWHLRPDSPLRPVVAGLYLHDTPTLNAAEYALRRISGQIASLKLLRFTLPLASRRNIRRIMTTLIKSRWSAPCTRSLCLSAGFVLTMRKSAPRSTAWPTPQTLWPPGPARLSRASIHPALRTTLQALRRCRPHPARSSGEAPAVPARRVKDVLNQERQRVDEDLRQPTAAAAYLRAYLPQRRHARRRRCTPRWLAPLAYTPY
jgi:hypothetical protein